MAVVKVIGCDKTDTRDEDTGAVLCTSYWLEIEYTLAGDTVRDCVTVPVEVYECFQGLLEQGAG